VGYEALHAANETEAAKLTSSRKINLIIPDDDVPKLGDVSMMKAIRSSSTPTVLITDAANGAAEATEGFENVVRLGKSFSLAHWLSAVRGLKDQTAP